MPDVLAGRRVLIAAHGNSLRALVKHLDGVSEDDDRLAQHPDRHPARLRARPRTCKPIRSRYLGDPEAAKKAAEAVANQSKAGA